MRQLKITHSITNRNSSSVDIYLSEIAREEILTPAEEERIASLIRRGDSVAMQKLLEQT